MTYSDAAPSEQRRAECDESVAEESSCGISSLSSACCASLHSNASSSSSLSALPQAAAAPAATESVFDRRWGPSCVRIDSRLYIDPTAPENVVLPPPSSSSQNHQQPYIWGAGSDRYNVRHFQKFARKSSGVTVNKIGNSPTPAGSEHESCPSSGVRGREDTAEDGASSTTTGFVTHCCNVHVNLKGVGFRDADSNYLTSILEGRLAFPGASSSPFSAQCGRRTTCAASPASCRSKPKHQKQIQNAATRSGGPSKEITAKGGLESSEPDAVFFVSLDLSENQLTCRGIAQLAKWFIKHSRYIRLRVLKVYKNLISDGGALALAGLILKQPSALEELHLSHNRIKTAGAEALFKSIGQARLKCYNETAKAAHMHVYPRPDPTRQEFLPVWIRLEYNNIADTHGLLQKWESEMRGSRSFDPSWKLVCFADRPNHPHGSKDPHCSPARCLRSINGHAALLHLYSFYHQSPIISGPLSTSGHRSGATVDRGKSKGGEAVGNLGSRGDSGQGTSSGKPSRKVEAGASQSRGSKAKREKRVPVSQDLVNTEQQTTTTVTSVRVEVKHGQSGQKRERGETAPQTVRESCVRPNGSTTSTHSSFSSPETQPVEQQPQPVTLEKLSSLLVPPPAVPVPRPTPGGRLLSPLVQPREVIETSEHIRCTSEYVSRPQERHTTTTDDAVWFPGPSVFSPASSRSKPTEVGTAVPSQGNNLFTAPGVSNTGGPDLVDSAVVAVGRVRQKKNVEYTKLVPSTVGQTYVDNNEPSVWSLLKRHNVEQPLQHALGRKSCTEGPSIPATFGARNENRAATNTLPFMISGRDVECPAALNESAIRQRSQLISEAVLGRSLPLSKKFGSCHMEHPVTQCAEKMSVGGECGMPLRNWVPGSKNKPSECVDGAVGYCNGAAELLSGVVDPSIVQSVISKVTEECVSSSFVHQLPAKLNANPRNVACQQLSGYDDDNIPLYIFLDTSAFVEMRKLFKRGKVNLFSFPALFALYQKKVLSQSFATLRENPEAAGAAAPAGTRKGLIFMCLDAVGDGIMKMTETQPFLRKSLAELQKDFVQPLTECGVIEKVDGLGDTAAYPDWMTLDKDIFEQAKALECSAFESLRVLDFACVWGYHLNYTNDGGPRLLNDATSNCATTERPFSLFVTANPKVEKFFAYLTQRQLAISQRVSRCNGNIKNDGNLRGDGVIEGGWNLLCTHIDRLNARLLAAFPELASLVCENGAFEHLSHSPRGSFPKKQPVFSASAVRNLLRQQLSVSCDSMLDTTALITELTGGLDNKSSSNTSASFHARTSGASSRTDLLSQPLFVASAGSGNKKVHPGRMLNGSAEGSHGYEEMRTRMNGIVHSHPQRSSEVMEQEMQHLRDNNDKLRGEVCRAYKLLSEIIQSYVQPQHPRQRFQEEGLPLKKHLLRRCVNQCQEWKSLLTSNSWANKQADISDDDILLYHSHS